MILGQSVWTLGHQSVLLKCKKKKKKKNGKRRYLRGSSMRK